MKKPYTIIFTLGLKYLLIASIILTLCNTAFAQTWTPVGNPGFSDSSAANTSIAFDTGGTPYVVYQDLRYNKKATVKKYDGSSWVTVGSPAFSAGEADFTSIAIDKYGTPYVAYSDGTTSIWDQTTVMKYNGSSWVTVGSVGFSSGSAENTAIAIDSSGVPYVVYAEWGGAGKAVVMKYNGSSWINVGSSSGLSVSSVVYPSMAIAPDGTLYVAYRDGSTPANKATVMKYNGSSWVTVGSANFSAGQVTYTSIAIDRSSTPYVAYVDGGSGWKATVMKYNGSSWVTVGSAGFSDSIVNNTALEIDTSGTPYVVYVDYALSSKATVMKYNGSSWVTAGNAGFSAGLPGLPTITIWGDAPYVAYEDFGNNAKATVMTLDTGTTRVKNITDPVAVLSIFPNPTHNSFTLHISSPQKEDVTIIITNILGEKIKEFVTTTNTETDVQLDASPSMYFVTAATSQGNQSAKLEMR